MRTGWSASLAILAQHWWLVARYVKRGANYRAMWIIAATILWL
jgi:hypothetical protein